MPDLSFPSWPYGSSSSSAIVVSGLITGSTAAGTTNSALINSALTAGDAAGGQEIVVNAWGTVYLANTLIWGKSRLTIGRNTNLKMGTSALTPVPMFRNSAYANRLSNFLVITSMTFSAATGLVTVNCTAHGKSVLDEACIWGANQNGYNGIFPVYAVTNANTFTFIPDEVPTVATAVASTFLLDSSGAANMRLLTPDIGGRLDCYGTCDFDGLYTSQLGDPGNAGGLNGPNASTPTSGNFTDYDIGSFMFTKDWVVNLWGAMQHAREHVLWICHSKNFRSEAVNITNSGADGVHLTGPIQGAYITNVIGHTIDNIFAVGTSDYTGFNLSEGAAKGIIVNKVYGNDCLLDLVRFIGESQYPIDAQINEIGGSVQSTGTLFNAFYDPVMVQGGNLWVRNIIVGEITGATQNTAVCSCSAFRTDYLEIGPFTMGVQNQAGLLLGGPASATAKHIIVNGAKSLDDQSNANYGNIVYQNSSTLTIDTLILNRIEHGRTTNAGTAGSGIPFEQNAGAVKHLVFNEPNFKGGLSLFRLQNTVEMKVDINNIYATTPTQIGIVGTSSSARSTVSLNGGYIAMTTGTMFAMQATSTTEIELRGGGCMVPGTFDNSVGVISRSGSQVCKIFNWDLFSDPVANTAISVARGQFMSSNRGGVNDARYGACVSQGTNWYTLATGAAGVNTSIT